MRLLAARLGGIEPFEIEPQPLLEFVGMTQLRGVVAIERDDQRALVAVFRRDPGGALQFAREIGPQTLAFERQLQQLFFARFGLDRSGEHPSRGPAGAVPGFAAVVDGDRAAGLGETPGDAETDDAGADDDRLRALL